MGGCEEKKYDLKYKGIEELIKYTFLFIIQINIISLFGVNFLYMCEVFILYLCGHYDFPIKKSYCEEI